MTKRTNKAGMRKLEKTIEVRTDLMIGLMKYVEGKYIEEGKDTTQITETIEICKRVQEEQKLQHLENRIARKLYMREYRLRNKEKIKQINKDYREQQKAKNGTK